MVLVDLRAWALIAVLAAMPVQASHADGIQWACGGRGGGTTGHPDWCGIDPVGGQGVQSVGEPTWGAAWVDGDEPVLGIEIHGDARAVPVKMLDRHEILNDEIGGVPVAVTYCPLCGSGISFERTVTFAGGVQVLDFAASGFLWRHDLVMWDAQTGTLWNQILGEAIGALVDDRVEPAHPDLRLTIVPTQLTSWDAWRSAHVQTMMLQPASGSTYGGAYAGYGGSCRIGIGYESVCDIEGLHPKEPVFGIDGPYGAIAFPTVPLSRAGVAVHEGIVAVSDAGLRRAYDAGRHSFTETDDGWLDEEGRPWELSEGRRADGGESLFPLDGVVMYWFAWRDHHPATEVWLPADGEGTKDLRDNGRLPGFTIGIIAVFFIGLAALWRRF